MARRFGLPQDLDINVRVSKIVNAGGKNIAGPVPTRGKYSVIWVADKLPEQIKDFLTVKREIMNKLTRYGLENTFANWVALEKSKTKIELMPDELWITIDKSKYSAQNEAASEG